MVNPGQIRSARDIAGTRAESVPGGVRRRHRRSAEDAEGRIREPIVIADKMRKAYGAGK